MSARPSGFDPVNAAAVPAVESAMAAPLPHPAARPATPASGGAMASTVRPDEQARFNALAATWWNPLGPMRPLHVLNALRLQTVVGLVQQHRGLAAGAGLAGVRVLDVGCGAGLMSEPLAQRGAQVTALDAAERSIAIGRQHAQAAGVAVDCRVGEPAQVLAPAERFDVVLLLEVVEHVQDVDAFVARVLHHLAPGGLVVASTINRTWRSWAVAIVGAEWVLRLLPRGTHRWSQLVTPAELSAAMAGAGLRQRSITGMRYRPLSHRAQWCRSVAVNYMASYAATPDAAGPDRSIGPPDSPAQESLS